MAFSMPSGLIVGQEHGQVNSDHEVAAIEDTQPSGTRMLVALGFPFRWPGFGWTADQADWAVRNIGGLDAWPEPTKGDHHRVVVPDDDDAVWWICYRSSPAWWLVIIGVLAAFLLAAIVIRMVWTILPQDAKQGFDAIINDLPQLLVLVIAATAMMVLPKMLEGIMPMKLPGG